MPTIPTMEEMLKAGVHFGHQSSHWHPKMEPYIYTIRNEMHIIDVKQTQSALEKACAMISSIVENGGDVLFVGTKSQSQPLIEQYATEAGMPFIRGRWIGGLLTNFRVVKLVIKKFLTMKRDKESGDWEKKYTKKEQVELGKELKKLDIEVSGLATMNNLPKALFVVDIRTEKTAVSEARKMDIPVFAICDTNVNPSRVSHVIPGNDDATRGIELMLKTIAEACKEGMKKRASMPTPEKKAAKAAPKKRVVRKPKKAEKAA